MGISYLRTLLMCSESIIKKEYLMKKHHQERIPDEKVCFSTSVIYLLTHLDAFH
ncbi:hypothetical protein HYC85_017712 [Camellia sinensis]|uniref:Uncharacterized protein n=1 Tax=Camellia sinensis TaxID=4442 RepID=A0A7J7GTV2_CAMSI|nr:hypothetical protein HYC85_017712 [Camellia sinensis]